MHLEMSKLIVGTMTWGAWGRKFTTEEATQLIQRCLDLGLNTFDHADIYDGYTTEAEFGKAFQSSGIARESIIHISKCGIQMPCEARPLNVKHYDYTQKHIIQSAEKSLTNLKTDYIDVLLLHRPSPLMQVEEIAAAFAQLKSNGKVKSFGVSNFTPSQMTYLQQEVDLDWNQIECSLSHNEPMFDGSLDYHLSQQIKSMAWSPLGNYFKEKNIANERVHQLMQELCTTYNATEDQLLLAWLLHHPAKIYPVLGTTRIERLTASLAAENITLQLTDWFRLLEAQWGHEVP